LPPPRARRTPPSAAPPGPGNKNPPPQARQRGERDVAGDRHLHDEPLLASILGDEADPRVHGTAGRAPAHRAPVEGHAARVEAVDAEDRASDLAAAGADQPGQRDDLAGPHVERDVGEDPLARQTLHAQDRLPDALLLRDVLYELAPDHGA